MSMHPFVIELQRRGMLEQMTSQEIDLKNGDRIYAGFDPTADSLHLGNMVPIMALAWAQRYNLQPVVIVGGATGLIGDPSGKSTERPLLDKAQIDKNLQGISEDLRLQIAFDGPLAAIMLNNLDWYIGMSSIDFLRDVCKNFRVGPMLGKESVRSRLSSQEGMSLTELCYQVLQGYDFLKLYDDHRVLLQLGGNDQWGNITAGIDLIRKMRGVKVDGLGLTLLTKSDGKKFGKSESGAIWINPKKLSSYQFYQELLKVSDSDVIRLLRFLTFLPLDEIDEIEHSMKNAPPFTAQKRLAEDLTLRLHGKEGLQNAQKATAVAQPGHATRPTSAAELLSVAAELPTLEFDRERILGVHFVDILVTSGICESKGEAKRLIRNRGAYLNNEAVDDEGHVLTSDDLIEGKLLLIGSGKKKKTVVKIR